MAPPRKWDHEEGLRLFAAGWSIPRIARHVGVSDASVRRVCDPVYRESGLESARRNGRGAVCEECGKTIWKARAQGVSRPASGRYCASCARLQTVRPDTLLCTTCGEWKPDDQFPYSHGRGKAVRRWRHGMCRACQTVIRRIYRNIRKVPCVDCGTPVLPRTPGEAGRSLARGLTEPRCRSCASRYRWRQAA